MFRSVHAFRVSSHFLGLEEKENLVMTCKTSREGEKVNPAETSLEDHQVNSAATSATEEEESSVMFKASAENEEATFWKSVFSYLPFRYNESSH